MKHGRIIEVKGQKQWDKSMEQAMQQQRLVCVEPFMFRTVVVIHLKLKNLACRS